MTEEEKTFEKIAGYPMYKKLSTGRWKKNADNDNDWWNRMCSDFPHEGEFYRRLIIAESY